MELSQKVKIIDWIIYLVLWVIAIYCIIQSNVIQNYFNKDSDTYKTEIETTGTILPDFSFCDWSKRILDLQDSFEIDYKLYDPVQHKDITIDNFTIQHFHYGECFRLSLPPDMKITFDMDHVIRFEFNSTIMDIHQISAMVSAKNNIMVRKILSARSTSAS